MKFQFDKVTKSLKSTSPSIDETNTKRVGYPRIELRYDMNTIMHQNLLRAEVMKDFIDMDDLTISDQIKNSTEYIIHTSDKNEHTLEITVKTNSTISAKQKKLRDEISFNEFSEENILFT